jgi:hypothetical protein
LPASEEEGGLDESTEDVYIPILIRNKLGLGFPMPAVWHGFVFLGGVSSGRRRGCVEVGSDICGGFPDLVGGVRSSEEHELAGSGVMCLLWIRSSSPFASPSSSPAISSGEDLGRYVYRLAVKPGWFFSTTCSGGFIPLLDVPLSGVWELLVALEAPGSLYSGDVMVSAWAFNCHKVCR